MSELITGSYNDRYTNRRILYFTYLTVKSATHHGTHTHVAVTASFIIIYHRRRWQLQWRVFTASVCLYQHFS